MSQNMSAADFANYARPLLHSTDAKQRAIYNYARTALGVLLAAQNNRSAYLDSDRHHFSAVLADCFALSRMSDFSTEQRQQVVAFLNAAQIYTGVTSLLIAA